MNAKQIAYRTAAVQGASGLGLLIALYDRLISDLQGAADAQRSRDIQRRGREVNHALLVLGFMENWIERESGGELAQHLLTFYSRLRHSLITAQATQSADILHKLMEELVDLRQIWRDVELRSATPDAAARSMPEIRVDSSHELTAACTWSA